MLIMTNLLFPKTKIMLQKTLKYKLATIKLVVFNSLWYMYSMRNVLTSRVKFISKGNANISQSTDCVLLQ